MSRIKPDMSSPYSVLEEQRLYKVALCILSLDKRQSVGSDRRLVCSLSGGVGFGKSTLAARLSRILCDLTGQMVCAIESDGWLRSNAWLKQVGLFDKKGTIETHDFQALKQFIQAVKSGKCAVGPSYAHSVSEPDSERLQRVPEDCGMVILEGVGAMAVQDEVDIRLLLDVPREVAWQRYWSRLQQKIAQAPEGSHLALKYRAVAKVDWEMIARETNARVNEPVNRAQSEQSVDIRLCVGACGTLQSVICAI